MLEKGIILELKEHYAIVLLPGGELIRIKRKDGMQVGEQIFILPEDRYANTSTPAVTVLPKKRHSGDPYRRERWMRQLVGLAAVFVLIITLTLYPGVPAVYAVASFDGGQDLQLELDRQSRIVNGYSYGAPLPEEELHSLKGKKLADVGSQLTAYLGDGPVLIGYASQQGDAEQDALIEQLLRDMFSNHIILYLSGNQEDIQLAESTEKSLGFYLMGEIVDDDTWDVLDDFLDAYDAYQEQAEDLAEEQEDAEDALSEKDDLSYLEEMPFDELLEEIHRNPSYEGNDEVLELLADRMEELHDEHKEQNWDSDEDDEDDTETEEDQSPEDSEPEQEDD